MQKKRERQILDVVYARNSLDEIIESERPDFLLRLLNATSYFGVEVTEFYESESSARLDRIQDYRSTLLGGGDFKHKDDRRNLTVDKISVLTAGGETKASGIPAIIQQVPSVTDCARAVSRLVERKADIASSNPNLTHSNLIVSDTTRLLNYIPVSDFFPAFFINELRVALCETLFREVFLLTNLGGQLRIVPLRMMLVLSELYFFRSVFVALQESGRFPPELDLVSTFASYLNAVVRSAVYSLAEPPSVEIINGDTGVLVGVDNSVTVRMHSDHPIPKGARPVPSIDSGLCSVLLEEMSTFRSKNTFQTSLWLPTQTSVVPTENQ